MVAGHSRQLDLHKGAVNIFHRGEDWVLKDEVVKLSQTLSKLLKLVFHTLDVGCFAHVGAFQAVVYLVKK